MKNPTNIIPSILDIIPFDASSIGRTAATQVKIKVVFIVLLLAGIPSLAKRAARATAIVISITFPPIASPKESSGTPLRAADIPTKRLGREPTTDISKKETTNSFQPKNFAILLKLLTINSPEK